MVVNLWKLWNDENSSGDALKKDIFKHIQKLCKFENPLTIF